MPSSEEGLSQAVRPKIAAYLRAHGSETASPSELYDHVLREVERTLIEEILSFVKGNQSRAAQMLGIHRNTLRKKIKHFKIKSRK